MIVIQSQLGITNFLGNANKHLLARKSHAFIKSIGIPTPLIKPSHIFLSRKYKKSLNPVINNENWDEGGLANESILTDYTQVNYPNHVSENLTHTQNNDINETTKILDNHDINPIITEEKKQQEEINLVNKKSHKSHINKKNRSKLKTKVKTASKSNTKTQPKIKPKQNDDINLQTTVDKFSIEENQSKNIHINTQDDLSITNNNSDLLKTDSDIEVLKNIDNNQVTQFKTENDSGNENHAPNSFTSEVSIIEDNQNHIETNNKTELNHPLNLESQESFTPEKSSHIEAEEISENFTDELIEKKSVNPENSPSIVEEPSILVNDFNNQQDSNNQTSIINNVDFPISETTSQTEILSDNVDSVDDNQLFSVDDSSQPIITNQNEIENPKIQADTDFTASKISDSSKPIEMPSDNITSIINNQPEPIITTQNELENPQKSTNLHPDISNSNIQNKEALDSQTFKESSNQQNISEISENNINQPLDNTSITPLIAEETSTLISENSNYQDINIQNPIQPEIPLDSIISDTDNQADTAQTDNNQNFSNISHSQSIVTPTNETQNNPVIPHQSTEFEQQPVKPDESTDSQSFTINLDESTASEFSQSIDVTNQEIQREVKQISDENQHLENINQEILPSQEGNNSTELPLESTEVISDVTDNDELQKSTSSNTNSQISVPKQTDIEIEEIEQTIEQTTYKSNQISKEENIPVIPEISNHENNSNLSPEFEEIIPTIPDAEQKLEEKTIPLKLISDINHQTNSDISNTTNIKDLPENLLQPSSETETPIHNPDLSVEQDNPEIQTTFITEQQSDNILNTPDNTSNIDLENKLDENQNQNLKSKFHQKFNQKLENQQPIQGYATGGKVIESPVEKNQPIAPSDTIPAMLTPGEFVVNAQDAQQNIDILENINSGKKAEEIIQPSLEESIPTETSNPVIQRKESQIIPSSTSNSLTSPSLGVEIEQNQPPLINSSNTNQPENISPKITPASTNNYSSSNLIFRKQNNHQTNEVPSQWSNVEELLNGESNELTTLFDFGAEETNSHNSDSYSSNSQYSNSQNSNYQNVNFHHVKSSHASQTPSDTVRIAPKLISEVQNIHQSREIPPDISRDIEPISETIENPAFTGEANENEQQDTQDLEILANEIYQRLRQRLEIEKERQGASFGRLPW